MAFLQSNVRHTVLVAGFGSGKSFAGVLKTVIKKIENKNIDVAYYLPTYPLVKDIAFPKFIEILDLLNVKYKLNRTDKEFITDYGRIILRTMDNPELIVGYEVGYSLIDEADVMPTNKMQDVFVKIIARNRRVLSNGINQTDFVSTPEGYKFLYNFCLKENPDRKLIKGKTSDNPFLPIGYIDGLKDVYSEQQLAAYLNGEFVNLTTGSVYHTYNRDQNNTILEIAPNDVLHIGLDFNITKMNVVVHVAQAGILHAVEEIVNAYDTAQTISIIKTRFPNHQVVIYPDASGDARKTSSESTDHDMLKKAGFIVKSPRKNPSVRDRISQMNMCFLNDKNEIKYYVNKNNCPTYTQALEQLAYNNGVPDKQSGLDHITDAGGYACWGVLHETRVLRTSFRS